MQCLTSCLSPQDLFSALIKGPTRTPYEDGLFLFDIQLPNIYPAVPPLFRYLSQCSGRLNPNLYDNGKVCVSLLGTWIGKVMPGEQGLCWAAFGETHFLPDWVTSALGWCLSWGGLGFGLWFRCLKQIIRVLWLFLGLYLGSTQ